MTAASVKSGTGHTYLTNFSTNATPDLYQNAPATGSGSGYHLGGNVTSTDPYSGSSYAYWWGTVGTFTNGDLYGRKATGLTFSSNAVGTVVMLHSGNLSGVTYAFNEETCANGGFFCTLRSSTGNDITYCFDGRDEINWSLDYTPAIFDPRYTATAYHTTGTVAPASLTQIEVHIQPRSSTNGGNGFAAVWVANAYIVTPYVVINGTSGSPGSILTVQNDATRGIAAAYLRSLPVAGTTYSPYFSYHIGDGSTATYVVESGTSFIFPTTSNTSAKFLKAHIGQGQLGIKFTGSGADTCNFTNVTVTGGGPYFEMNAASGDTNVLTGCSINNAATLTLSNYTTITNCTFTGCVTVPLTSSPTVNSMAVAATQSTYAVDCGTNTAIANVAFTALGPSDYAIKISPTGTGSFALTGCTFSGYTTGYKIYVNDSNAGHTITISGSGIASADITSAGATIVVPTTTTTIKHTALINGTRYIVYNAGGGGTTAQELANTTVSGTGFTLSLTSNIATGDVIYLYTTYQSTTTVEWGGPWLATATVGGTIDFSANSPGTQSAFVTWGYDGSTATECSTDYTHIQVDLSTSGTSYSRNKILAFIAYAMTTASGITNWFRLIGSPILTVNSAAQVVVNTTLTITNTGSTAVVLTDSTYVHRSDNGALLASGSGSLTMETTPIYLVSAGSGLTTAEHNQLMSVPLNPLLENVGSTRSAEIDTINTNTAATATNVTAINQIHGLDLSHALTVSTTARAVGTITQTISTSGGTTTVTRTA